MIIHDVIAIVKFIYTKKQLFFADDNLYLIKKGTVAFATVPFAHRFIIIDRQKHLQLSVCRCEDRFQCQK